MNCCGQKRQGLQFTSATEVSVHETETKNNLITIDQRPVYFRYTGNSALRVKGLFDIIYTFSAQRPQLLVHPEDVSVMRGYGNLTEIRET
jgi:predicted ribosome-associated RNA-binding protein Tma20